MIELNSMSGNYHLFSPANQVQLSTYTKSRDSSASISTSLVSLGCSPTEQKIRATFFSPSCLTIRAEESFCGCSAYSCIVPGPGGLAGWFTGRAGGDTIITPWHCFFSSRFCRRRINVTYACNSDGGRPAAKLSPNIRHRFLSEISSAEKSEDISDTF